MRGRNALFSQFVGNAADDGAGACGCVMYQRHTSDVLFAAIC